MNAKQTTLDAYLAGTAVTYTKSGRLQQLPDDHFGHDPDAIHYRKRCIPACQGENLSTLGSTTTSERVVEPLIKPKTVLRNASGSF